MNLSTDKRSPVGGQQQQNAGAVAFGGPQQTAPANFQVGAVGFGPTWQDDEPSLREMYDRACQTIVRLEREADENKAQLATYEVERGIIEKELRRLREQVAELRAGRLEQTL